MSTNQKPSMLHKIVGTDSEGTRRERPFEKGWQAEAEAKRLLNRGWSDIEVQTWDTKSHQFAFNSSLNKHLEDADEKRIKVNEDAIDSLAVLASTVKSMYKSASDGSVTQEEINAFERQCLITLHNLGVQTVDYASTR